VELILILLVPVLASGISLSPIGHRIAAPATALASAIVLALALGVAVQAAGGHGTSAIDGWLSCDGLGALVLLLVAFVGFTAALFSWGYLAHHAGAGRRPRLRTYYALFNLFLASMLAVPTMANVALMWIAVELTTLLSAFLVGFEDTPEALEAAWKYIILTTLGAVVALLGFLMLYWGLRIAGEDSFTWSGLLAAAPHMPPALLWSAFLIVLVGFGTKVGLVPMHTWLPDAHSQAPAPVCALLSGVETTTVLYVILRLFPVVGATPGLDPRPWFIALGLISIAAAALLLLYVRDYKRMFAFSTVEHMGIILVAGGLGGADAHFAAAYQIAAHSLAKSFCFFAAGAAVLAVGTQEIASVRGLARSSPATAVALVTGGLAITGAPPFAVFISEFLILKAGLASGQYVVVGLLAIFLVIAFCAVMSHINRMSFGIAQPASASAGLPGLCGTALVLAAIPMLAIGFYLPAEFAALLKAASAAIGN
jgi:hydrogenase-4 component F